MSDSQTISVNGHPVILDKAATLLEAAAQADVSIPTMCYRSDLEPYTSCMLCLVADDADGKLKPACSTRATAGMSIQTNTDAVNEARTTALALLLSEHVGDCNGPCQRFCPAGMNIPKMLHEIADGEFQTALQTVKRHIALPAILGRICPAPCEKGCRRNAHDSAVSICLLKRFVADLDLMSNQPWQPSCNASTGKHIAVVGSGPAGLAATSELLQLGHAVTVIEAQQALGGALHNCVKDKTLPLDILRQEIALIQKLGATFETGICIGKDRSLTDLHTAFDAICIATGPLSPEATKPFGLSMTSRGIQVDKNRMTSLTGIFACGSAVHPLRMAVQALADGRNTAQAIDRHLMQTKAKPTEFDSKIRDIQPSETSALLAKASPASRVSPTAGQHGGYSIKEAQAEAKRCMHCECGKADNCLLRLHATTYQPHQQHYASGQRVPVERITQKGGLIYEPGKCIKCGICVRITKRDGEPLGLTYIGRGFDIRIGVPFERSLEEGLQKVAKRCAEACPTGALICGK